MRFVAPFALASAIGLLAVAHAVPPSSELRIVGTDLLGLDVSKAIYDFSATRDLPVKLALDGSRPGLEALKAGRAHLALLVLPAEEEGALKDFTAVTIGYHRVVVIAPIACPLERITFEQLAAVFGGGAKGERWSDLGLGGDWSNAPVTAILPEVGTGLTTELFRHVVLHDRPFKPTAVRYRDFATLRTRFKGETYPLALAAQWPESAPEVKVLAVSSDANAPAFLPSPENLQSGEYPLRLPVRAVFRRESANVVGSLLEYLAGDELAPRLEQVGLVPASAATRVQQLAALEKK